jgi:GAF domain-containing protein
LAVPIIVGDRVLGVLDVQADSKTQLSDEDVVIQTTLAAQIGVAMQNARSFMQSEATQQELSQLTRRLTHEGWEEYLTRQERPEMRVSIGEAPANGQSLKQSLMIQGEQIGHLTLAEPQTFSQEAADIITAVAERLSSHIENLRLTAQTEVALAQTEQQARRLAILNDMGTAINAATNLAEIYNLAGQYTRQILRGDHTSLSLLDAGGDTFTGIGFLESGDTYTVHLPLAGTGVAYALEQQKPVVAPQDFSLHDIKAEILLQQGIQSYICAPLMVGDRQLGTLNIGSRVAHAYGAADISLVQQIVSLLAATLQSRRLFDETRRRAEREALVNAISQKIQNAPTIQSAMQTAVAELGKALQVKRAVVELSETGPLVER